MKKLFALLFIAWLLPLLTFGQVQIPKQWKFHIGDNMEWKNPDYEVSNWETIKVGQNWESQGHSGYNGFAWYRTSFIIPDSLKKDNYLKKYLLLEIGKIDDGDQVFLNGQSIGVNGGLGTDIKNGNWNAKRNYLIPVNEILIHWGNENVLAVRVYDHSGSGGMFEGPYKLRIAQLSDFIIIDHQTHRFHFSDNRHFKKKIALKTKNEEFSFSGKLSVEILNPATGKIMNEEDIDAHFSKGHPFEYVYKGTLPDNNSYVARYVFRDDKSDKMIVSTDGIPYFLTPPSSPKPQINGPTVKGIRSGHPFLYRIPVTGKRPMAFGAKNLPQGLHIDKNTGIISGKVKKKGEYEIQLMASNQLGEDTRKLTIKVGHLIGLTPAMGWNSWNVWGTSVSQEKVERAAKRMVQSGLVNHGWNYINIDDGWQRDERGKNGEIVPNDKFPNMKDLGKSIHEKGLLFGIYSSPGPKTCGGFTGSYKHEFQDAKTYAGWGVDYLKYDWCSYGQVAHENPNLKAMKKPYALMQKALNSLNRDIYYSLCQYGMGNVWKWGAEVDGNSWRTTGDIMDTWESMTKIGFYQDKAALYADPGHWNDPDMLLVGKVGWGDHLRNTRLTPDELYTHISLWSILSAPLLIGCDMSKLDKFTMNLLTNDEVLAIDQDPLGYEGRQVAQIDSVKIYTKKLADGGLAVGIFNVSKETKSVSIPFSVLNIEGKQRIRDVWRQKDLGTFVEGDRARDVPAHGVLLLKMESIKN